MLRHTVETIGRHPSSLSGLTMGLRASSLKVFHSADTRADTLLPHELYTKVTAMDEVGSVWMTLHRSMTPPVAGSELPLWSRRQLLCPKALRALSTRGRGKPGRQSGRRRIAHRELLY